MFIHDIYLASAYPMVVRRGRLIEADVVRAYRQTLQRDPYLNEALRDTAALRAGASPGSIQRKLRANRSLR